jgi:hypothetical protein
MQEAQIKLISQVCMPVLRQWTCRSTVLSHSYGGILGLWGVILTSGLTLAQVVVSLSMLLLAYLDEPWCLSLTLKTEFNLFFLLLLLFYSN